LLTQIRELREKLIKKVKEFKRRNVRKQMFKIEVIIIETKYNAEYQ
jgi:hypothetical protein